MYEVVVVQEEVKLLIFAEANMALLLTHMIMERQIRTGSLVLKTTTTSFKRCGATRPMPVQRATLDKMLAFS